MKKREKIDLNTTGMDLMVRMSEGNPGAITVLMEIMGSGDMGLFSILGLDDMNIRGTQIWVGYKDYYFQKWCPEGETLEGAPDQLEFFMANVKERSQGMIDCINAEPGMVDECGEAVEHGASFKRDGRWDINGKLSPERRRNVSTFNGGRSPGYNPL